MHAASIPSGGILLARQGAPVILSRPDSGARRRLTVRNFGTGADPGLIELPNGGLRELCGEPLTAEESPPSLP